MVVESLASTIRPICVYCGKLLYLWHNMEMIGVSNQFFKGQFKQNLFVERSIGHLFKNCQTNGLNQGYGRQEGQFQKETHMQGPGQRWGPGNV